MIVSITYGNEKFEKAKVFNCKMAKKYGADVAIAYGPEVLDEEFRRKNQALLMQKRGGGYWIWKPYIILKTLERLNEGDILIYTDAGAIFVKKISYLLQTMERENTDIMVFSLDHLEKTYTKRDAFILMECDTPAYTDTNQILSGYIICKKTERVLRLFTEWQKYILDERIVSDIPNRIGKDNYEGFIENRHDQSILSLLCKKYGVKPFRDPSQFGRGEYLVGVPKEVLDRSPYPQVIDSFRFGDVSSRFELKHRDEQWYIKTKYFWQQVKKKFQRYCDRRND